MPSLGVPPSQHINAFANPESPQISLLKRVFITQNLQSHLDQGSWTVRLKDLRSNLSGLYQHKMKVKSLSRVQLFATPWTVAHQASPSIEFSRHEYWSRFPSPGDLGLDPGLPHCRQMLHHLSHQGISYQHKFRRK